MDNGAYGRWSRIVDPQLSDDGQWVVYTKASAMGSAELVAHATQNRIEFRVSQNVGERYYSTRSYYADVLRESEAMATRITADSRRVLFPFYPSYLRAPVGDAEEIAIARFAGLGIIRLSNGEVTKILGVSEYKVPQESGRYVAYKVKREAPDVPQEITSADNEQLVLWDMVAEVEVQIAGAVEYIFDSKGHYLAYTIFTEVPENDGVYVRRLSDGHVTKLLSGPGQYRNLTFDGAGEQIAFLSNWSAEGAAQSDYKVYYSRSPQARAKAVGPAELLKSDLMIAPDAGLEFSRTGNALIFSVTPRAGDFTDNDDSDHSANFELWSWNEPKVLRRGRRSPSRPSLSVYHIGSQQWMQLGHEPYSTVQFTDDARYAIAFDPTPYEVRGPWYRTDVYLIDVVSGFRSKIRQAQHFHVGMELSPDGRYFIYFDDERWWSYDLVRGRTADLTGDLLPVIRFDSEDTDPRRDSGPVEQPVVGWTPDDQRLLLRGRNDVWEVDPTSTVAPRNLTSGLGRRTNVTFRRWEQVARSMYPKAGVLRRQSLVDVNQPLLLLGLDRDTMASSVWTVSLKDPGRQPKKLLMINKRIVPVARARYAEQYLITVETFAEYPDLWTGTRLNSLTRISDANPQQDEYRWGSAELIEFTSDFGVPLKGRLYMPEGFDPSRQYPMIVGIYGQHSDDIHVYTNPVPLSFAPFRSVSPVIPSRGYLYLAPDIRSTVPYPGQSAVSAVIPAVQAIIHRGYVDEQRICLNGHSFGAYEANYIITQTDVFRCAVTSAGISDSFSDYGSLLGTGRSKIFLYEHGQQRHGSSIWERPFVYIINSPLVYADRVDAPVLILHNDGDSTIPFAQSLEFFNALRRNGKEAWLLNYVGERHVIRNWTNRLDFDRRYWQFIDHYLKGAPRPDWMARNRPRSSPSLPVDSGSR